MTSATEELRRMLDERGVKWWAGWDEDMTCYDGADGVRYVADGTLGKLFFRTMLPVNPEQAVEATLGRGACEMRLRDDIHGHAYQDTYECSECGEQIVRETYMGKSEPPRFCPECGREVDG